MPERNEPESAEERNLRILVSAACTHAAPPLTPGLPAQLAARARRLDSPRIDLPLSAAACSIFGLALLAASALLPAGRTDLRSWALALPAANLLLAPFAAYIVIRNLYGEVSHVET
jgi:hypothetical protein